MQCSRKEHYGGGASSCGCGHMCTIKSVAVTLGVIFILKKMKML